MEYEIGQKKNIWEIISGPDLIVVAPREMPGLVIIHGTSQNEFVTQYQSLLKPQQMINDIDDIGKGDGVEG